MTDIFKLHLQESEGSSKDGPSSVPETHLPEVLQVEDSAGKDRDLEAEEPKALPEDGLGLLSEQEPSLEPDPPHCRAPLTEAEDRPVPICFTADLVESGSSAQPGTLWEVVLIEAGWSKNGKYYSADLLRESAPLFEGKPIAMYGFEPETYKDHVAASTRQQGGGLVQNIVGWSRNVRAREGARFALVADLQLANDQLRTLLLETHRSGPIPLGLSIDATGRGRRGLAEGRSGIIITAIDDVFETTLVTRPAAGGQFVRLIASAPPKGQDTVNKLKLFLMKFGHRANLEPAAVLRMTESEVTSAAAALLTQMKASGDLLDLAMTFLSEDKIEEATRLLEKLAAGFKEASEPAAAPDPNPTDSGTDEALFESRKELSAIRLERMLEASKLPEKAEAILKKRFVDRVFEVQELQEAIDEVKELTALGQPAAGVIQESTSQAQVTSDYADKWRRRLDLVFGYRPERDTSLTEAERAAYSEVRGRTSIKALFEDGQQLLTEAVTADIAGILGVAMTKSMAQSYGDAEDLFEDVIEVKEDVENFKLQERYILHGFSGLPVVSEDGEYGSLGFPGEEKKTYKVDKRGGLVRITREMVKNDDVGLLQQIVRRLGNAAKYELNLFKGKLITGNLGGAGINTDLSWDGKVLYHADHGNLATAAYSGTEMFAARLRMKKQREYTVVTTLSAGINDSVTAITVAKNEGILPGRKIQVGNEVMTVTAVNANGTGLTVVRGADNDAHLSGAKVYQIGRPIPARKMHLIFPDDIEQTVFASLASDKIPSSPNNDANFIHREAINGRIVPHSVDSAYLGDDLNNWYLINSPEDAPGPEMAFLDNERDPYLVLVDNPTGSNMLNFDRLVYKIRHEYGGTQTDHKGMQASLPA